LPTFYDLLQGLLGAQACRREFVDAYVRPREGDKVLDIGCGTAHILECLPPVEYHGFDSSEEYVSAARQKYGSRGHFTCGMVKHQTLLGLPQFDIALAIGVLHHLDDPEAISLFSLARSALKPGGRLVTFNPCYGEGQSTIAKLIVGMDRGQNVRDREGYKGLARSVFSDVRPDVRHDMVRMPYTHIVLECTA
jgi:2-polyprenyl-3-methyl-5-hydroxy-6-metoxy-1,4-benzoquinol methylase